MVFIFKQNTKIYLTLRKICFQKYLLLQQKKKKIVIKKYLKKSIWKFFSRRKCSLKLIIVFFIENIL